MPSDYDDDLLKEGIRHAKAGEERLARRYLERALDAADDSRTRALASFHLSQMEDDPKKKRQYLEETLAFDPVHPEARRALAILDGRLKPDEIIDPDALPPLPVGEQQAQADRFTCPNCGGRMVYAPDGGSLTCEFCASRQALGGKVADEQDFFAAMASARGHTTAVSTQVFHCQGCGAEFTLGARELSAVCAWCGSPQVVRQDRMLPSPDAILPFGFDGQEARRYLHQWLEKNSLVPAAEPPAPRPLYLPVWSFDLTGRIPWSGQVYRNEENVPISGEEVIYEDDVIIPAVRHQPRLVSALLAGLNFSVTAPYDPRYLAGWPAEVPALSLSNAALEARRIAVERASRSVQAEHGSVMNLRYQSSALSVSAYRLVLVPVWLAEVSVLVGKGGRNARMQSCPLLVDGVTGAVHGQPPSRRISAWLKSLLGG